MYNTVIQNFIDYTQLKLLKNIGCILHPCILFILYVVVWTSIFLSTAEWMKKM